MTQTQNISIRNALVRITMGLSMIAYGTAHFIKNPASNRGRMMIVLGAMKAGEGTLRYCPTKAVLNTSIQNIMSENSLGKTGNSPMQNMGAAMQNVGSTVGSTVQNMMGGSGSGTGGGTGTGTGTGSGNGLQNVVPEVTKLMKDFAGIGNTGGNSTTNNQTGNTGGNNNQTAATGNSTGPSNVFGSTSGNQNRNNSTGSTTGNTGVFNSANGNSTGNSGIFGSANGNANGNSGVFGSANGNATGNSGVFGSTPQKADNNAYGDPYKNTGGKNVTIGESSNKNGSAAINPS